MRRWKKYLTGFILLIVLIVIIGYIIPSDPVSPVDEQDIIKIDPESFWYYPWGEQGVHKGIDIFCKKQCRVQAPVSGIILKTGYGSISGNYIYLQGPKWKLYYVAHLDSVVHHGIFIRKGSLLGYSGNTGNAAGKPTHVHLSIQTIIPYPWRYDKKSPEGGLKIFYLNPLSEIGFPREKIYAE